MATVSHEALLAAVQAQPSGAVTANAPPPPSLVKSALPGDRSYVQTAADRPFWLTSYRAVPTAIEPARVSGDAFAATV